MKLKPRNFKVMKFQNYETNENLFKFDTLEAQVLKNENILVYVYSYHLNHFIWLL